MSQPPYDYSIYYSRFHDDSDQHAEEAAVWVQRTIEPHMPQDRSVAVIDIGCGYGFALRALRNLGFKNLLGLEVSAQQAERCRAAGFEIVTTENTIEWLNQNPGRFTHANLLDVLEHVPVDVQIDFMRAVRTSLRPGGKVLLSVPNANAMLFGRWRYNDYTHYSSFTEHSLYFVLKNAGFETIWTDSTKGIGRFPRRLWRRNSWPQARKWLVRWFWLQVFKAELPYERIENISFELNLLALATK